MIMTKNFEELRRLITKHTLINLMQMFI